MRTPDLPEQHKLVFPCEYFALFYKLEELMLEEDKLMRAQGGHFDGTLANLLLQSPDIYIPCPPGYARVQSANPGGGRKVSRGNKVETAPGGRGHNAHAGGAGGRQNKPSVLDRVGPPLAAGKEKAAHSWDCPFCHKTHREVAIVGSLTSTTRQSLAKPMQRTGIA